jgi:hypothetical protein
MWPFCGVGELRVSCSRTSAFDDYEFLLLDNPRNMRGAAPAATVTQVTYTIVACPHHSDGGPLR